MVKRCLGSNHMSITDERANKAFAELQGIISGLYNKPLSPTLRKRVRREWRAVRCVQRLLRSRPDIVIRPIDKGKSFFIGSKTTMERKIQEYMDKTAAYQEIIDGHSPLAESLAIVQNLLDYLVTQKAITKERRDKLIPSSSRLELAHLYTLPKVHKVKCPSHLSIMCSIDNLCFVF